MAKSKTLFRKQATRKSNNSAAFIVGSLVGGLVGALATLWKTPQSGEQLRSKITGAIPGVGDAPPAMEFSTTPATEPIVGSAEQYAPPPETNFPEPTPDRV